jgi:hypothetical protein
LVWGTARAPAWSAGAFAADALAVETGLAGGTFSGAAGFGPWAGWAFTGAFLPPSFSNTFSSRVEKLDWTSTPSARSSSMSRLEGIPNFFASS